MSRVEPLTHSYPNTILCEAMIWLGIIVITMVYGATLHSAQTLIIS